MNALRIFSIFVVLNVVILAFSNADEIEGTTAKIVKYKDLFRLTLKFPCKPQPRAFLAKEFLANSLPDGEKLKPNNIILHRCDKHSGCCPTDGHICNENTSEKVIFQLQANDAFNGQTRLIEITEFNHTSCVCSASAPPKRN